MVALLLVAAEGEPDLNGFRIERHTVPREEIRAGGPPRDGIKSVDEPELASTAEAARWVVFGNPVIGVSIGDDAHAYPVHLIEWHQVVNDVVGGVPVVVTYDPIAGTAAAWRRKVGEHSGSGSERSGPERVLTFGVSGLVHRSNFLLYDRETESLWSQFFGRAISGELSGTQLERVRTRQETFGMWMRRHPESKVLARPFPRNIDYRYRPYDVSYWVTDDVPFPLDAEDPRYHRKEVVLGVEVDGHARAYIGSVLTEAGGRIVDEFQGRKLRIEYDGSSSTFSWEAPADVAVSDAYWFAWKNLHPDTGIWNDAAARPEVE